MLRRTSLVSLKHRPKTVSIEPGSNRHLEAPILAKAKDIFSVPEFPGKKVMHNWRFFIRAGKAATGPPVGQEFSKLGLKVMDFTKAFNDRTKPIFKDDVDLIVRIQVYFDKSFNYRVEPPPTAWFLLKAIRKKRRETGLVQLRGCYCAYITLEMIYEIAKMKQMIWEKWDYPPIETRVRRIAGQARRMGVAILGVDTPNSPIKGMTEKQYEADCAKYRAIHMQQYEELKHKELLEAPLMERIHRPDISGLSEKQLQDGLLDPKLFNELWKASHPKSKFHSSQQEREMALKYINTRGWLKEMTPEEIQLVFFNKNLGAKERAAQLSQEAAEETYWGRDANNSAQQK